MVRPRYTAFLSAATLAFVLTACDKTPSGVSEEQPEDVTLQQTAGQGTFGNLIAALNNISVQIDRLNALNDLTIGDVTVVNVQDVLNNSLNQNVVRILENAIQRNNVEILTLQNVLNNSPITILNDALNNILITDVIAINVLSGGDVIVFAR